MTPDSALFFAAGFGTRMGELTRDTPKPMLRVAGIPLIDHALRLGQKAGLLNIVVNTHYKSEILHRHLAKQNVQISDEADGILETGGGLRKALPLLGPAPVFTMNSDAVWSGKNPFEELAGLWNPKRMEALLLLIPRSNALGHTGDGDFLLNEKGQLRRGPGLVYSGAQILQTNGLADIKEAAFSLNLLWEVMIERGTLFGMVHSGGWCDVGRPESLALANEMVGDPNV